MPWLEQRSGRFLISFRWQGKKHRQKIAAKTRRDAEAVLARFCETLDLVERGRLDVPPSADICSFLLSDGKLTERPSTACVEEKAKTLEDLTEDYLATFENGSREANTLLTARIHLNHIARTLRDSFPIASLTLADLQKHVERRAKVMTRRDKPISAYTIHKEIKTLRAAWNWGLEMEWLSRPFPSMKMLSLPKQDEKPPFHTLEEIQRRISRGGLSESEQSQLWRSLYLNRGEIARLLEHLRSECRESFLYPMAAIACHTGARRSELCRIQIDDLDLDGRTLLLREKKRIKGKTTTRRVPLSEYLCTTLATWVHTHAGDQCLFPSPRVAPKRAFGGVASGLTPSEAHLHLCRALAGTVFEHARWHTFRHSFVSNCAAVGVDQRIISEWVGHQTEEQERRYRHLFPDLQRRAMDSVFG